MAERYLDDFDRYPEVARLNHLRDADRIRPGQLIKLPTEADDTGARRHASGHLVPSTPRKPSPRPPVTTPGTPGGRCRPAAGRSGLADHPGQAHQPGDPRHPEADRKGRAGHPADRHPAKRPAPGQAPGAATGRATRRGATGDGRRSVPATPDDAINRPLAVSAVLAVASIVGAQIGAVLGLRRRPARVVAGRTSAARIAAARMSTNRTTTGRTPGRSMGSRASAARDLVTGRHRRDSPTHPTRA